MLQAAYTPEAWAGMVRHPQNRLDAVRPIIEKLGGTIERGWLAFGEYDGYRPARAGGKQPAKLEAPFSTM